MDNQYYLQSIPSFAFVIKVTEGGKKSRFFLHSLKFSKLFVMVDVPVSDVVPLENLSLTSQMYSVFLKGACEMAPVSLNTRILIDGMIAN